MVKSLKLLGKSLGCRLRNGSCFGGDGGGSSEGYEITYNATGGGEKMECVWCASEGVYDGSDGCVGSDGDDGSGGGGADSHDARGEKASRIRGKAAPRTRP